MCSLFLLSYMYMCECQRKVNNKNKSPIQILYNRCNRVPQLPPYCTMVNDPNDQCCQMPYCQNPNPTPNPNPSPNGSPTVVSMQLFRWISKDRVGVLMITNIGLQGVNFLMAKTEKWCHERTDSLQWNKLLW